ncbi:MAG: alpha/beta hydrolase family protein [Promethearchaeota archaeon]
MEFKDKQYDGPYEVSEIEINNEGQIFKGILYFPREDFKKPYPLIIYFHDFPHLFTLREIVRDYQYLLESGFAFLVFNFRGYRYSEGIISIESQVSDSFKVIEFIQFMSKNGILSIKDINILAHGFGAYIALILCSQITSINKLLLLCPILDLEKHVYSESFSKSLQYINRFLPGNIRGIEHVDDFIKKTKIELKRREYQIKIFIKEVHYNKMKIIIGEADKITPLNELNNIIRKNHKNIDIVVVSGMDHICIEDGHLEKIKNEITSFFIN